MTQVTRTTNDLIVNSLYLLGELAVGEAADAFMLSSGLEIINEILDGFSAASIYVPFLDTLNHTFEVGKQTYSISDMVSDADIESNRIVDLVFANYTVDAADNNSVTYVLDIISKDQYYNNAILGNFETRPGFVFLDKQATESFITVYPFPDQAYPFSIKVKSMLNSLGAQSNLNGLPPYWYGFFKYALARAFRAYYPSNNWPDTNENQYQEYYTNLKNSSETDLSIRPSSLLCSTESSYYWQNILAY